MKRIRMQTRRPEIKYDSLVRIKAKIRCSKAMLNFAIYLLTLTLITLIVEASVT